MTKAQNTFYFRLWGMVRKVDPKADRKAIHAELGLPESHLMFRNADFDKWKSYCLAKAQPDNFRAQIAQVTMPATRKQVFIRQLLAALEQGEEYAESIIARMQRKKKLISTGAGSMLTLETLCPEDLEKVMIALKKECRRRWKTKDELLGEIHILRTEANLDEKAAAAAVMKALCTDHLPPLLKLYYEPLLVVLGVLRELAAGRVPDFGHEPELFADVEQESTVNTPF